MAVFRDVERRWRLLVPPETVLIEPGPRKQVVRQLRALPPATVVAITGRRGLRQLARQGQLAVRTEYLALPSLANPVAITQRDPDTLAWTARTVLTVPPGVTRGHRLAWWAVRTVRAFPRLLGLAPVGDRLLVGTRS